MSSSIDNIYKFILNNGIGITKCILTGALIAYITNRYILQRNPTNKSGTSKKQGKIRDNPIRIKKILLYPIKSCKGVELTTSELDNFGLTFDRNWMLVNSEGRFMTQRTTPQMSLLTPRISEDGKFLIVSAPDMKDLHVAINYSPETPLIKSQVWKDSVDVIDCGDEASRFFSEFLKKDSVRLVQVPSKDRYTRNISDKYLQNLEGGVAKNEQYQVNLSDASQVMVLSQSSIDALNKKIRDERTSKGEEQRPDLTWERFRPNILVTGTEPYEEDHWSTFRIGNLLFKTVDHTGRCKLTTVESSTGVLDPYHDDEPLRTMRTFRQVDSKAPLFGILTIHNGDGSINIGDIVDVIDDNFESKNHITPIFNSTTTPQ